MSLYHKIAFLLFCIILCIQKGISAEPFETRYDATLHLIYETCTDTIKCKIPMIINHECMVFDSDISAIKFWYNKGNYYIICGIRDKRFNTPNSWSCDFMGDLVIDETYTLAPNLFCGNQLFYHNGGFERNEPVFLMDGFIQDNTMPFLTPFRIGESIGDTMAKLEISIVDCDKIKKIIFLVDISSIKLPYKEQRILFTFYESKLASIEIGDGFNIIPL